MREGETIEVKWELSATVGENGEKLIIITLKLCSETNNHAVRLRKQF